MDNKPTLKEFLRNNPGKGLNDYYEEYGDIKDSRPLTPVIQPVAPTKKKQKKHTDTTHIVDRSDEFPQDPPPSKKKTGVDILTVLASLLVIVAFFLPWINVEGFKMFKETTNIPGYGLFEGLGQIYNAEPDYLDYTIFLIVGGAIITLLGELARSWVIRIAGEVLVVAFNIFWIYALHQTFGYALEALKMEELELFKFLQYGLYISSAGALLLFIDLLRTLFGNR